MRHTDDEILNIGTACLVEKLGIVEAQQFIAAVKREKFDYTKWQREHFDDVDLDALLAAAYACDDAHPIGKRAHSGKTG